MRLRIDLRQLECFVAVAQEKGFRAAAERLHMSQPPLSRQIQQLESELGVPLLRRHPSGTDLTLAGRIFLPEAKKTLAQAHRAVEMIRRGSRVESTESCPSRAITRCCWRKSAAAGQSGSYPSR